MRSREKKMSCFWAFDSNLPVRDVQIRNGRRSGLAGSGRRTEKRESRERPLRQSKGVGGGGGHALIQSKRGLCLKVIFISVVAQPVPGVQNGSWNRLQLGPSQGRGPAPLASPRSVIGSHFPFRSRALSPLPQRLQQVIYE